MRPKKDKKDKNDLSKKPRLKKKRKKVCIFCKDNRPIDYKDLELMRRFVTDRGKIAPPRFSGCCASHQRKIAKAIKRSRQAGILAYTAE